MSVSARADVAGSVARLAWVDRLKVATIAGVVVVHVATAYVVDIGWYYEERTTSQVTPVVLGVPAFLAGVFGLAPLFLVGGWMAAGSLARRGAGPFARARLVRLGVPTLLYFLLVDPFADYLGGRVQGESRTLVDYLTDIGGDRDLGPVWFITVLLVLSLAYAAWRRLRPPRARPGGLSWRILAVAALGIAVADLVLWLRWSYFSQTLWNLNWQHWAQAAGVFAVGALARERGWLDDVPRSLARTSGLVATASLVLFTALAAYGFATEDESLVTGFGPFAVTFALVDGLGALTLSVWAWAWFRRRWSGPPGAALARASRGAYAAYLLHPVVLVLLSGAAHSLPWAPEAKFVLVSAVGVPAVFAVGWLVTRVPGVSRVL